ncbi:MAG TPA: cob(I)yrinic acid a,c-diamide adenosyltransferase [Cellvibrionaceae bacterium]
MTDSQDAEHQAAMQDTQQKVRAAVAAAKEKRGVIIYLYGQGKGKSSSGFGTLLRAVGHGQTAAVVQFIKGTWKTGEQQFFQQHPKVHYEIMGTGFTWDSQNRQKDMAAAEAVWQKATAFLQDESINLILFDEITYMFDYGYLDLANCIAALKQKPLMQNIILTGRSAIPELIELADTVSEINDIKHAFRSGVKAQRGIEF